MTAPNYEEAYTAGIMPVSTISTDYLVKYENNKWIIDVDGSSLKVWQSVKFKNKNFKICKISGGQVFLYSQSDLGTYTLEAGQDPANIDTACANVIGQDDRIIEVRSCIVSDLIENPFPVGSQNFFTTSNYPYQGYPSLYAYDGGDITHPYLSNPGGSYTLTYGLYPIVILDATNFTNYQNGYWIID